MIRALRKFGSQCQGASASATFQKLKDQAYRRSEQDTLITASDYKDCEKLCRESSSCTALTHFRAEKICRLMPSATELTANEGADSALRIEPSTGSIEALLNRPLRRRIAYAGMRLRASPEGARTCRQDAIC
jgi:hypothetical protein